MSDLAEPSRLARWAARVWPSARRAGAVLDMPGAALTQPTAESVQRQPPKPLRLAADANLRAGESPQESLQTVRRAQVGRWWIQLRPWSPGFRAEAHTLSGPPGVWAGELRPTLREATDDAVAMIDVLRHE